MTWDQPTLTPSHSADYQKRKWWQRTRKWTWMLAIPLVGGFTGMAGLLTALRLTPLPVGALASPTRLTAADGTELAEWTIKGTHAAQVPLAEIPKTLQDATLAVEDDKFYQHGALDLTSVARALIVNIRHGRVEQGGSTITQQLAKNLFLNQDRTLARKVREALYAIQLELHEPKQQILEQYLNFVYYGHGAYGVPLAAELYFNKPVQVLTLPECAMLAGIPKGPSFYDPLTHFSAAKSRQWIVLNRMVKAGYLTQAEADKAYATPLTISNRHPNLSRAPYFTQTALQEVERRYQLDANDLYAGDIHITTTLDPVLQQAAEHAVASTLPKTGKLQAALVALNPHTGALLAMVGGRDYETSPYNRTLADRQPGSTFKSVLYTAALQNGWTPARQVDSEVTTFAYDRTKRYTVHDFGEFYAHRPLTLREALQRSDNVYAVTANLEVGPSQVIRTAQDMGIHTQLLPYPSLALGVFPTSPIEMATAYATLANGGYRVTPYAVESLRGPKVDGAITTTPEKNQVISPQLAFQMTDLLTSVLQPNGTGYAVHGYLHGMAAAKTGTTDTDGWMVGYTPNVVCAVWVGYDDNRPLTLNEAHLASPIWAKFMGLAQQRLPAEWFTPPSGLVLRTVDPVTAQLATDTCKDTESDYFVKGTEPTEFCRLHPASRPPTVLQPKSFLHWLRTWL